MSDWLDDITASVQRADAQGQAHADAVSAARAAREENFRVSRDHIAQIVAPLLTAAAARLSSLGRAASVVVPPSTSETTDDRYVCRLVIAQSELVFGTNSRTGIGGIYVTPIIAGSSRTPESICVEDLTEQVVQERIARFASTAVGDPDAPRDGR